MGQGKTEKEHSEHKRTVHNTNLQIEKSEKKNMKTNVQTKTV